MVQCEYFLSLFCILFYFKNRVCYHRHAHRCWRVLSLRCLVVYCLPFTAAAFAHHRTCATDTHHHHGTEEHCALRPRVINPTWTCLGFFQVFWFYILMTFFHHHHLTLCPSLCMNLHFGANRGATTNLTLARFFLKKSYLYFYIKYLLFKKIC